MILHIAIHIHNMHMYKTGKEGEWKGGFDEEEDIRRGGRKGGSEGRIEEGKDRGREGRRDERRKTGRERGEREFKSKGRGGSGKVMYKEWERDGQR